LNENVDTTDPYTYEVEEEEEEYDPLQKNDIVVSLTQIKHRLLKY